MESCQNPKYQLDIGREVVVVDPNYFRPTEVDLLIGDPSKAKRELGWAPKYIRDNHKGNDGIRFETNETRSISE